MDNSSKPKTTDTTLQPFTYISIILIGSTLCVLSLGQTLHHHMSKLKNSHTVVRNLVNTWWEQSYISFHFIFIMCWEKWKQKIHYLLTSWCGIQTTNNALELKNFNLHTIASVVWKNLLVKFVHTVESFYISIQRWHGIYSWSC